MSTPSDADAEARAEAKYAEQCSVANDGIISFDISIAKTENEIRAKETELRQADPSEATSLQTQLSELEARLDSEKKGLSLFQTAKADLRALPSAPSKSFDEIIRVSEGLICPDRQLDELTTRAKVHDDRAGSP